MSNRKSADALANDPLVTSFKGGLANPQDLRTLIVNTGIGVARVKQAIVAGTYRKNGGTCGVLVWNALSEPVEEMRLELEERGLKPTASELQERFNDVWTWARKLDNAHENGTDPTECAEMLLGLLNPMMKLLGTIVRRVRSGSSSNIPHANLKKPTSRLAKITKEEASLKARECLLKKPNATARELASDVGCSVGLVPELPAWRAVVEQRNKGRKPRPPKAVNLSDAVVANEPQEDAELQRLIGEQEADAEPSPLDDGDTEVHYRKSV